jgi:hypothetical protein
MIGACIAVVVLQAAQLDPTQLERILTRNEETLGRIRTLRTTIEMKASEDGGKSWKTIETVNVTRSGRRELTRGTLFGSFFGDQWREGKGLSAALFAPEEQRILGGWDPENPPRVPLEGEDVSRIKGGLSAPPPYGPEGWHNAWKAKAMLLPEADASIRDLLKTFSARSLERRDDASGDTIWEVELRPIGQNIVTYYKFAFSQKHGYLAVRQEGGVAARGEKPYVAVREVQEFWDLGSGLAFPKLVRTTTTRRPNSLYRTEVKQAVVNQPIDEGELTLEFPQGAIVVDHRSGHYHLWGKGGPARTFAGANDFNAWNQARLGVLYASKNKRPGLLNPVVLGIAVCSAAALCALLVYRRRLAGRTA